MSSIWDFRSVKPTTPPKVRPTILKKRIRQTVLGLTVWLIAANSGLCSDPVTASGIGSTQTQSHIESDGTSPPAKLSTSQIFVAYKHAYRLKEYEKAKAILDQLDSKVEDILKSVVVYERIKYYRDTNSIMSLLQYLMQSGHEAQLTLLKDELKKTFLDQVSDYPNRRAVKACLEKMMVLFPDWKTDPDMLEIYYNTFPKNDDGRMKTAIDFWVYADMDEFGEQLQRVSEFIKQNVSDYDDQIAHHFLQQKRYQNYDYIVGALPEFLDRFDVGNESFEQLKDVYFQALFRKQQYSKLIDILTSEKTRQDYRIDSLSSQKLLIQLWLKKGRIDLATEILKEIESKYGSENLATIYYGFGVFFYDRNRLQRSRFYLERVKGYSIQKWLLEDVQWKLMRIYQELNNHAAIKEIATWSENHEFDNEEVAAKFCYWSIKLTRPDNPDALTCYQRYPLTYYGFRALQSRKGNPSLDQSLFNLPGKLKRTPISSQEKEFLEFLRILYENGDDEFGDILSKEFMKRQKNVTFFLHLSDILYKAERFYLQQLLVDYYFGEHLDMEDSLGRTLLPASFPSGYREAVLKYSNGSIVPEHLVLAVIREESNFRPDVQSNAGAVGLMQLMPDTAKYIGKTIRLKVDPNELTNPNLNVRLGIAYLKRLIKRFKGNIYYALAAYNGGPTNVKRWIKKSGGEDIDQFVETITFEETKNYVKRVIRSFYIYQKLYG